MHPKNRLQVMLICMMMLIGATLACALPAPGADAIATSVAATLTAVHSSEASETEAADLTPAATPSSTISPTSGTITGQICYPSDMIPAMTAYFEETNTHILTTLPIAEDQGTYSIDLTPGTYHAYAWRDGYSFGGSYSQAVPCGLNVSCTDHSLIPILVTAGETVSDVDICDWYGESGDVPLPPGVVLPTPTAPPGGISLNCDGTYQRVRIIDEGASGKTIIVDNWESDAWVNVWNIAGGDPMIRQIEDEAGYYQFGDCQKLVIVPIRYGGSGAPLELSIHVWNGSGLTQVYFDEGTHGVWSKHGDRIDFEESIYLYGEPNCCPCNRQMLENTWNGTAFIQTGSAINPTYTGEPPDHCRP